MKESLQVLFKSISAFIILIIYKGDVFKLKRSYQLKKSTIKSFIYYSYLSNFCSYIGIECNIKSKIIFPHGFFGVFVSDGAEIGNNVVIFQHVTIGSNTLKDSQKNGSPTIGDNVYIGAGAKIIGKVKIGDNVRIGANCIVVKDVPANNVVVLFEGRLIKKNKMNNSFQSREEYIKYAEETEWKILYEYITNLQSEIEEKDSEIAKLKEDIENLNNDIAENYRPIPRAEQYDMGECNFH